VWVPNTISEDELLVQIKQEAGDLLVTSSCFDRYEKEDKISFAYRLVFQSHEKTLTDEEVNVVMDNITEKLNSTEGYEVR
jgi:phenylalanyl-tRNA synthetase beta subunit